MHRPIPVIPGPGRESVWDYPRPPAIEPVERHIRVVADELVVADTVRAIRVLETSHPPTYYVPVDDVRPGTLAPAEGASWCEWKGGATYFDVCTPDPVERAAWWYPEPALPYAALRHHIAFYPGLVACFVDGERVEPQPGSFYGGWVTSDVVGPFKGAPGSMGW